MVEIIATALIERKAFQEQSRLLMRFLPEKRRERIRRFKHTDDAQRSLLGELVVRSLLVRKLNIRNDMIHLTTNQYGKPRFLQSEKIHFNMAHSGQWVVCAFSEFPVGVDIEEIKPVDPDIARRFFAPEETQALMAKKETERLRFFFELWTVKESFVKAVGTGMSTPLDKFVVTIADGEIEIHNKLDKKSRKVYFKQYDFGASYKMAVCAHESRFADDIVMVPMEEIVHELSSK